MLTYDEAPATLTFEIQGGVVPGIPTATKVLQLPLRLEERLRLLRDHAWVGVMGSPARTEGEAPVVPALSHFSFRSFGGPWAGRCTSHVACGRK